MVPDSALQSFLCATGSSAFLWSTKVDVLHIEDIEHIWAMFSAFSEN